MHFPGLPVDACRLVAVTPVRLPPGPTYLSDRVDSEPDSTVVNPTSTVAIMVPVNEVISGCLWKENEGQDAFSR